MGVWWMPLEDRVSPSVAKAKHTSAHNMRFVFLKFNTTTMQTSSEPIHIIPWNSRSKKTDTNNADSHAAGWIMNNKTHCIWPRSLMSSSSIQKTLAFYLLSFHVRWNFRYFTVINSTLPVTECWSPNATYPRIYASHSPSCFYYPVSLDLRLDSSSQVTLFCCWSSLPFPFPRPRILLLLYKIDFDVLWPFAVR